MSDCLFDEDEEDAFAPAPTNILVVGPAIKPDELNLLEDRYRRLGAPPVLFEDSSDEGEPIAECLQPPSVAIAMGLGPKGVVTLAEAEQWIAEQIAGGRWQ